LEEFIIFNTKSMFSVISPFFLLITSVYNDKSFRKNKDLKQDKTKWMQDYFFKDWATKSLLL